MNEHSHFPEIGRLSVVAAIILLAYALIPHISNSAREIAVQISGISFRLPVNYATLITFFAAAITAAGTDWLLSGHPYVGKARRISHWVLPALTAWVIGVPLGQLDIGFGWWIIFGMGCALLLLVIIAEYITLDNTDSRYMTASLSLTAVAFAMLMVIAIAVRGVGFRLYLVEIAIIPTVTLVVLRTLNLKLEGKWCWHWALAIGLMIGELAFGLHYSPLSPLKFGLILTGVAYALTSLAEGWEVGHKLRSMWIEPVLAVVIFSVLAFVINA